MAKKVQSVLKETSDGVPFPGVRHVQMMLIFAMLTIGIGMRVQLSVAIVAMTDNTTSLNPDIPTYHWDNKSVILSSFYWGYLTLQLIAGALGRTYGTKKFLVIAMLLNSTANLLIPLAAANLGSYGVMACRIFQGIAQGFFVPSVYNLLGCWTPVSERSRLGSIALAGFSFSSILTMPLVGYISSSSIGWPFTFYLYGALGYVWVVLWTIFGASNPSEHKTILHKEKTYIEKSLGAEKETKFNDIPWRAILTSIPTWAIALVAIGLNWGLITLATETPVYLNKVMKFEIKSDSLLATAPYLAGFLSSFFFAFLADYAINNNYMSRGTTRKVFTTVACVTSSITLIILSYLPDNSNGLSVTMLIAHGFFQSALTGGSAVNQIDLSPRFAGIIMALTNSVSNAISLLAPLLVQAVVTDETDKSQWRIIFLVICGLTLSMNLAYIILGSGDLQPWNSFGDDENTTIDDEKIRKVSRKISMVMNYL